MAPPPFEYGEDDENITTSHCFDDHPDGYGLLIFARSILRMRVEK